MRLESLHAVRFRSLLDSGEITFGPLTVFIGANASGKSTILDALAFAAEAVRQKSFVDAIQARGGMNHLSWKGEDKDSIRIRTRYTASDGFAAEWRLALHPKAHQELVISEELLESSKPPRKLLESLDGRGKWWTIDEQEQPAERPLSLQPADCALVAASVDPGFVGRRVSEFVSAWGFFDPTTWSLRRSGRSDDPLRLSFDGSNLAARLEEIQRSDSQRYAEILTATQAILGLPNRLHFVHSENGRVFFTQEEPGLKHRVFQVGASSGTLRLLALVTALLGQGMPSLVAIEEPENHLHPGALDGFAQLLLKASERTQVVVTTHSPRLLDMLERPEVVRVVRRTDEGTKVEAPLDRARTLKALQESGFGLGEFLETRGFGS